MPAETDGRRPPLYRPGIRGWWAHLRLAECLRDGDGIQWRAIWRRGRISARLRQAEQERDYWQRCEGGRVEGWHVSFPQGSMSN